MPGHSPFTGGRSSFSELADKYSDDLSVDLYAESSLDYSQRLDALEQVGRCIKILSTVRTGTLNTPSGHTVCTQEEMRESHSMARFYLTNLQQDLQQALYGNGD